MTTQKDVENAITHLITVLNNYELLVEIKVCSSGKISTSIFDKPRKYEYHAKINFCSTIP